MTRTSTWLSTLSCAVVLATIAGCGGSSPAGNGTAGHDGGAGTGSTAGTGGGAAGSTAGTGGGTAGTTGAAGGTAGAAGAAGGTAGAAGTSADAGSDVKVDAASDTKVDAAADMSTDVPATPCVQGGTCSGDFSCSITRTCRRNQEQLCFCAPNGKIACEPCSEVDAGDAGGADAGPGDGGADAGAPMCPANIVNRTTTCTAANERCSGACTNMRQEACLCFNPPGGDNLNHWFCQSIRCQ